jgi:phosphoribosylaminoimidazole carboxylase PurE protein
MRIGVLSGGGDAPGLNAVIRAVTKTAIFKYGWEVVGIIDGFEGLLSPTKTRQLTSWNTRGILFVGGTILGTTNRGNPFAHKTVVNGKEIMEDMSSLVLNNINELGLEALVVIGGDGSLKIGHGLHKLGVPVIGVPIRTASFGGQDSLLSIVQMPGGVPVATMTIGKAGAKNAAIFAAQILALKYPEIHKKLVAHKIKMEKDIEVKAEALKKKPGKKQ